MAVGGGRARRWLSNVERSRPLAESDGHANAWTWCAQICESGKAQVVQRCLRRHWQRLRRPLEEQAGRIAPGPDALGESEILLRGIVKDSHVERFGW